MSKKVFNVFFISLFVLLVFTQCNSREKAIEASVEKAKQMVPYRMDDVTVWDSCVYVKPTTIIYYYSVQTGFIAEDAVANVKNLAYQATMTSLQTTIDPQTKALIALNPKMRYVYLDTTGKYLFDYTIQPHEE